MEALVQTFTKETKVGGSVAKQPSALALEAFKSKELEIYNGLKSTNSSKAQLLQKYKSIDELNRTWKTDPWYWTEIRSFINAHPELKDYELSGGILKFKPPVSNLTGVTIIIANKNELVEQVASELRLSKEQETIMIKRLTDFDITQKRNNVYQKIKVNGEWEIDTTARRKSLLKTEAERIIKEWKDAEQKKMDEQNARELAQREREEARVNAEKQAEAKKLAANLARYGLTIENLRKHIEGTLKGKDDPDKIIPEIYSKVLSYLHQNLDPKDREYEMIKIIAPVLKDFIEQAKLKGQASIPEPSKLVNGAGGGSSSSSSRSNPFCDPRSDYYQNPQTNIRKHRDMNSKW